MVQRVKDLDCGDAGHGFGWDSVAGLGTSMCCRSGQKKKSSLRVFFLIRNKCWILSNASASVKMMVCFKFFLNYTVNQVDWSSDVSPGATSTWS